MDADIRELEEKISKLIALCRSLRNENNELREKSATLKTKIDQASVKLEHLLSQLPEGEKAA